MKAVRDIRKISLGSNYKDAMHYIVGQKVLGDEYTIINILQNSDELFFEIWIQKDNEIILWKEVTKDIPVVVEYNINF